VKDKVIEENVMKVLFKAKYGNLWIKATIVDQLDSCYIIEVGTKRYTVDADQILFPKEETL
jgi:hypothetical protein